MRSLNVGHRLLLGALVALALAMKLAMPQGFMLTFADGRAFLSACSTSGAMASPLPVGAHQHDGFGEGEHERKAERSCAFAGLSAQALFGADPALLAASIMFVMALGTRALSLPALTSPLHMWPPLRGPPAHS